MNVLKGACIVGQSGGPTSVINASAYGVIRTALDSGDITKVYGAEHGIKGVLNFTSTPLNFPQGIVVENYDITTLLEKVAYFVKENEESNSSNA